MNDLDILNVMKWAILTLLILFIIYIFVIAIPRGKRCEDICKRDKPSGEILVTSSVESFPSICECKYSESNRNFKLRYPF